MAPNYPGFRHIVSSSPWLAPQDSGTLVEIDFEARVLRSGSAFDLRAFDTRQPLEVRQQVAAGDADNLI